MVNIGTLYWMVCPPGQLTGYRACARAAHVLWNRTMLLKKTGSAAFVTLLAVGGALAVLQASPAHTASQIQAVDGAGLKKAVAAQKGKVTVVNLWATWCGPCVDEFPDLVKLHNAYKERGLEFLSVSVDEPEDRGKVVAFINQQKASFPVYMRRGGSVESYINPLDKKWPGAVPVTYIFNKQGKLAGKPIVGSRTYAQFEAAIKPLL